MHPLIVMAQEEHLYAGLLFAPMVKANNGSGFRVQLGATGPELRRVLHADDDLDILELAHLALDELGGLEVLQLPSGKDLIETALRFKPDLILLDVMMPDISGEELIAKIKEVEHLKNIPIVFMTAKGNQMAKDSLLALGASAVVIKPFDPLVLADRLREIHGSTATETLS